MHHQWAPADVSQTGTVSSPVKGARVCAFCRRINGWSSSLRTSRSPAKSWRESSGNWPSRRTIVLGMTAATDHVRTTILIRGVWISAPYCWRDMRGLWFFLCFFYESLSYVASPYFNPSELDLSFWQSHSEFQSCRSCRSMNVRFSSSWSSLLGWDYKLCLLMKQPSRSRTGVVGCFFHSSLPLDNWHCDASQ